MTSVLSWNDRTYRYMSEIHVDASFNVNVKAVFGSTNVLHDLNVPYIQFKMAWQKDFEGCYANCKDYSSAFHLALVSVTRFLQAAVFICLIRSLTMKRNNFNIYIYICFVMVSWNNL